MAHKTKEKNNFKYNLFFLLFSLGAIAVLMFLYATTNIELVLASFAVGNSISTQILLIFLPILLLALLPAWFCLRLINVKEAPLITRIILFAIIYILFAGLSCIFAVAAAWGG